MSDPHIHFRRPVCVVHHDFTSWSAKYYCYLGHHYEKGKECWVVGAYNVLTDIRTERHYNEANGAKDPKAEALVFWEPFMQGMLKAPEAEESDEVSLEMREFFQREVKRKGIVTDEEKSNIV